MSGFFKNKRKLTAFLCALLLIVTMATGSAAYLMDGFSPSLRPPESSESTAPSSSEEEEPVVAASTEPEEEIETNALPDFNMPVDMRGVYITPGVDFLKTSDTSIDLMRKDIDQAIEQAKKLTMNTVIIDTVYKDKAIFQTQDAPKLTDDFDIMQYIVDTARKADLHVLAIFDVSLVQSRPSMSMMSVGAGSIDRLSSNLKEFTEKYDLDAILLDGYINETAEQSYPQYLNLGGAIGFDNFMRQTPAAAVKTAARAIRAQSPSTQVGLLADAVWENNTINEEGSATKATYTSLGTGNADTKGFVEAGLMDFIAVKSFSSLTDSSIPFGEVVKWWAGVAQKNDIPMYAVHASEKICTQEPGWQAQDQLVRQVIEASGVSGFKGSIFNNLARLVENPQESTTTLVKYYNQEVDPEHILTELAVTKPEKTTFTTFEPNVIFTGASDPNAPVTINGEEIPTDASGYFTINRELQAGENRFTITHKAKSINYVITRQIQVLQEASPMGSVTTEGSMRLTITALAHADAQVTARINGTSIVLSRDDSPDAEEDRDSAFRTFSGTYTVPAATSSVQNLGSIVVTASWQGQTDTITAANVRVNKRAKVEDGVPVVVVAEQAKTYPPDTLNNIPDQAYYPLPKGAKDYAVGNEIVYKKDGKTYSYFVLASGLRVETKDIQPTSDDDYVSGNTISGLSVTSEGGFTFLTLKTAQQVSYAFRYTNDAIHIKFHHTVQTPDNMKLSKNPLFTQATWDDSTLILRLAQPAAFMGYRGYYDSDGNLVFKFNNPPSSLSEARIVIDPGHGGKDVGALGFLAKYPEKTINQSIARYLEQELASRGATVKLLDTSGGMELEERVRQAERFNADLFISVHNNTAPRSSAVGTEAYYFYPYSWRLANNLSKQVSGQLNTTNRGPKASYYHITLSEQVPSVLLECGFMSNKNEYEKLIKKSYQERIAVGIADALSSTIRSTYTGSSSTGSQSTGEAASHTGDPVDSEEDGTTDENMEQLYLSEETLSLQVGESLTLSAYTDQSELRASSLDWETSRSAIATVSSDGRVRGVRKGTATITATTKDGKYKATCEVTVGDEGGQEAGSSSGIPLGSQQDIYFEHSDIVIYPDKSQQLLIYNIDEKQIRPSDFIWESSRTSVATVNSSGVVQARREGTTDITATARSDRDLYIRATVEVSRKSVEITSLSLDVDSISVVKGKTVPLKLSISPSHASSSDIRWESENSRIAKVDENGRVTGVNAGQTTIEARSRRGRQTVKCEVTVTRSEILPDYIQLSSDTLEMYVGEAEQLFAEVYPDDVTDLGVVWKSSNPSVVSVDRDGNIEALKRGRATITATATSDRNVSESCVIEVLE